MITRLFSLCKLFLLLLLLFSSSPLTLAQGKSVKRIATEEQEAMKLYDQGAYKEACDIFIRTNRMKANTQSSKLNFAIFLFFLVDAAGVFLFLYLEKKKAYKILVKRNVEWANKPNLSAMVSETSQPAISDKEQEVLNQLIVLIDKDKIFLNSELNINDLSRQLNTNRTVLSKVIGSAFNKTFPSFINQYRVEHAVKLLMDHSNANYTIEAIGQMCGFNNRQVFHYAFKNETGLTPNDFRTMSTSKNLDKQD